MMNIKCIVIASVLFIVGGNLYAQEEFDTGKSIFDRFSLHVKPLNADSLRAAIEDMGFGSISYPAKDFNLHDHVDDFGHNFPIYQLPMDKDYKLKRKVLPEDYPAKMPTFKFKKPEGVLEIIPQQE
ncbi:hypothetical protein DN752_10025 [Echinicola strongylocentroti]|uniref:Uncharacterized protein n=1 Tax=Echinicola strongylocentroti TaxID=1795355 RepID=A0A2Z4IGZ7_9BACT|nr:hypothetical protein [Echinicola strongylocentroti]AWW30431.1 hypothetical protein DN752_10025 [Echinicola strongylocentroti]